jgi:hypothetical protein
MVSSQSSVVRLQSSGFSRQFPLAGSSTCEADAQNLTCRYSTLQARDRGLKTEETTDA